MRRVHPFLSPVGIGMTFLIFLGLGFSLWRDGGRMFSPGELTAQIQASAILGGYTSHAAFESKCDYCHAPLETTQADLCLRCHTAVFEQLTSQTGSHAKLANINRCRECHPDHLGREFDITKAAFAYFDHTPTGFNLRWHQVDYDLTLLECGDCHQIESGFQWVSTTCESCHAGNNPSFMDLHRQNFGPECLACHDGIDRMTNFDHQASRFPLVGAHDQTDCAGCHLDGQFSGTPVDCISCHHEPKIHAGLFSQDCAVCHTSVQWSVLMGMEDVVFDHFEQTGFSLNLHFRDFADDPVLCADCHTSDDGFKVGFDLTFCVDCHTVENSLFMAEHQVQFGLLCLSCHDGVDRMHDFNHDSFFILDGQHAGINCESCHSDQNFQDTPSECAACHAEPEIHAGYFGLVCENCHSTAAWSPAKMQSHTFPIDHGDQGLVACEVCHAVRYTEYTCYGCHEHQPGEMIEKHQEEGITGSQLEACVDCHPNGFKEEDD